ncbi:MAG: F0F1 ATP synthase subunit A [Gemmataceae bacterium]|nr:F0F1 ATP synthase subunit A [Gemmataceae bacterium]
MLAGLLLFALPSSALAQEKEGAHKPPTAAEEVMDRRGKNERGEPEPWYIFHELHLALPLVGWFEFEIGGRGYTFPTKYEWLMVIAALLTFFIYKGLARRIQHGEVPAGPFWNFFESLLTFVRNEVAKPNFPEHADHGHAEEHPHAAHHDEPVSHEHPADRFVPLLWTLFVYILFCNLLGMVPFMGSPTANIYMTAALALCVFIIMHGAAVLRLGGFGYLKALWPKIDLPFFYGIGWLFGFTISLMIFVIELFSSVIKSGVLAIRLFANMFAGHMVLASILLFIVVTAESPLWPVVTVASVLGVIALSLLELFVAFLQAYIFTFLTALFIGMAVNPEH